MLHSVSKLHRLALQRIAKDCLQNFALLCCHICKVHLHRISFQTHLVPKGMHSTTYSHFPAYSNCAGQAIPFDIIRTHEYPASVTLAKQINFLIEAQLGVI